MDSYTIRARLLHSFELGVLLSESPLSFSLQKDRRQSSPPFFILFLRFFGREKRIHFPSFKKKRASERHVVFHVLRSIWTMGDEILFESIRKQEGRKKEEEEEESVSQIDRGGLTHLFSLLSAVMLVKKKNLSFFFCVRLLRGHHLGREPTVKLRHNTT